MLSTDSKTFDSSITFKQNYGTAASATSSTAIVKDGSGMVFQGVYTNIAATKSMIAASLNMTLTGALSSVAATGIAIIALSLAF